MSERRERKWTSLVGIAELTEKGWVFVLSSWGGSAGLSRQRSGTSSGSQVEERAEVTAQYLKGTRTLAARL